MKRDAYPLWLGMSFTLIALNAFGVLSFKVFSFQGLLVVMLGVAAFLTTQRGVDENHAWNMRLLDTQAGMLETMEQQSLIVQGQSATIQKQREMNKELLDLVVVMKDKLEKLKEANNEETT